MLTDPPILTDPPPRRKGPSPDPDYAFLLSWTDTGERVAIHGEATSYDPAKAELRTLAAVRIRGNRILTSGHRLFSFPAGGPAGPVVDELLRFIGTRPLVGYYLDFTTGLLDHHVQALAGMPLPNPRIEVSGLYYESRVKVPGKNALDLRLDSIVRALGLPARGGTDAYANALAAAMVYLRLSPPEPR